MPAPTELGAYDRLPDGHPTPTGRTLNGAGAGTPGRALRQTSRKFYRSSAKDPAEQQRRQAWGRKWGEIVKTEAARLRAERH